MKYVVSYTSDATGFSWVHECETIEEVKYITDKVRCIDSVMVTVWDKSWGDCVYYKNYLSNKPKTNHIYNHRADLRTQNKPTK